TRWSVTGVQTCALPISRIDWATATDNATNDPNGLIPALTLTKEQQLSASGSASLNIGPGYVVATVNSLTLDMATANVVTGNPLKIGRASCRERVTNTGL